MTLPPARLALPLVLAGVFVFPAGAQQLIGYVNTRDADVTGASDVLDGQAVLSGSVSVTAKDHTAPILLGRGGSVRVCQTSMLHLTERREMSVSAPLLFSLDRGAIEIQMGGTPNDSIMTPDLRFTVRSAGPLDLRLRVARNGDTCVENRGSAAPTLAVSDPFGESMYEVAPGQHVLFEHGSLREVVDHESSPCGCPDAQGMSMADALLASGGGKTMAPAPPAPPPAVVQAPAPAVVATRPPAPAPAPAVVATPPPVPAPTQAVVTAPPPARVPAPVLAPAPAPAPAVAAVVAPAPVVMTAPPPAPAPAPTPAPVAAPPSEQEVQAAEEAAARAAIQAANQHPFPAAVSEGLAPTPEPTQAPPSQARIQMTDQLSYNAPATAEPAPAAKAPAAPVAPVKAQRQKQPKPAKASKSQATTTQPAAMTAKPAAKTAKAPAPPQPPVNDVAHIVGRFFKHIFVWH